MQGLLRVYGNTKNIWKLYKYNEELNEEAKVIINTTGAGRVRHIFIFFSFLLFFRPHPTTSQVFVRFFPLSLSLFYLFFFFTTSALGVSNGSRFFCGFHSRTKGYLSYYFTQSACFIDSLPIFSSSLRLKTQQQTHTHTRRYK